MNGRKQSIWKHLPGVIAAVLLAVAPEPSFAAPNLSWSSDNTEISADVTDGQLMPVLENVAEHTHWQIFVEPGLTQTVSARFQSLPVGNALRMLLGELNFALVPSPQGARLYVFRTSRQNATQQVRPQPLPEISGIKLIGNELVVRIKPGANIDEIAKALGATVVGRMDDQHLYRLRFDDVESADAARKALASNSDVESVENNYAIDRPGGGRPVVSTTAVAPHLELRPPPQTGAVVVGLVDTGVQSLGSELDKFVKRQISVAGTSVLDPSVPSHGTSMLATLLNSLAEASNGSTSVQVLPVDVYGPNAITSTFQVAQGIVQAINNGANVINLSLGSEVSSPYLDNLIRDTSQNNNILYIGAAGNQPVTTPYYPAADPGVLAVTATENGQIAPWANYGSFVDLGAPGTSVVYFNGEAYYVVGTSSAAAYTSGVAAAHRESGDSAQGTASFLMSNYGIAPQK